MSFVPENDLERALIHAKDDDGARAEFHRQLLAAGLYVIGEIVGTPQIDGQINIRPGDQLKIGEITLQGRRYHPIFSAKSRLEAYVREYVRFIVLPGRALFADARGKDFMLNPGSDFATELLAGEIAGLLGRKKAKR